MVQTLLSVPPNLRDHIASPDGKPSWERRLAATAGAPPFIGTDPRARKLGSGGGTLNLLVEAWRASGTPAPLSAWITGNKKLVLHAGGESRRLPAYAALGKAFLPMPRVAGLYPQRFDQMLVDFQVPRYQQVLREAGPKPILLVTSGDVWLDFDPLQIPAVTADIAGIGMRVSPEVAQHFGVFFVAKNSGRSATGERPIAFFLQKPAPAQIYKHLAQYDFYVDTGMWLFSDAAIHLLLRRCGWNEKKQVFATADGFASYLDLYTEIGIALGEQTRAPAALEKLGWSAIRRSVIPLDDAHFYHLGSTRQLFESFEQIQRGQISPRKTLAVGTREETADLKSSLPVWLDATEADERLRLGGHNLIVGLTPEMTVREFHTDRCLEVQPAGANQFVFRPFHLDDDFRGTSKKGARICGQDAASWLAARGMSQPDTDVFDLELYPLLPSREITQSLFEWFFAAKPGAETTEWIKAQRRISARQLPREINYTRMFAQRNLQYAKAIKSEFETCLIHGDSRVFNQDFSAIADFTGRGSAFARWLITNRDAILANTPRPEHQSRFLLLLSELGPKADRDRFAAEAYQRLRSSIISSNQLGKVSPLLALKEDQIVWGRSPVRLDLAGGWTDTPPFCLEAGGAVLNMAVLLNGQPPIQVFIRPLDEFLFRLRSIDLGSSEDITSYQGLADFTDPKSRFSLPKAALGLAGFHPDYLASEGYRSLGAQLKAFGSGLEISLLSAVPKGSGLGTSSILGAVLLAGLNRACGLGWDEVDLYNRVLGVEQLLTTGGGWQDQAGALFRSVKFIQTKPGLDQAPLVRYLPDHLLTQNQANQTLLLYYTGATRLAKGILKEIVHDMFLNRASTVETLALIRRNAEQLYHALQGGSAESLVRCIGRSWDLNKRLDSGTSTSVIEEIIARCGDDLAACKLLGAGGGGYMLICAKNPASGRKIREKLEKTPPNPRARFIDFQLSDRALEVTVS